MKTKIERMKMTNSMFRKKEKMHDILKHNEMLLTKIYDIQVRKVYFFIMRIDLVQWDCKD